MRTAWQRIILERIAGTVPQPTPQFSKLPSVTSQCFVVAAAHVLQLRQLALILSLFFRMPKLQPCSVVCDGLHSRRVRIFFPGMPQVARGAAAGGASTRNMLPTQLLDERV